MVDVLNSHFFTISIMIGQKRKETAEEAAEPIAHDHKITKLNDIDHALHAADFYIGQAVHSVSPPVSRFLFNGKSELMEYRENLLYPHGLLKIFDEALVNAGDNVHRGTKLIRVGVNRIQNAIWVFNDGKNFSITPTEHPSRANESKKAYQPELAFFHPKSSSAFTKTKRVTGGKFGLGAKLIGIFSRWSTVEMCDGKTYYYQKAEDHMKIVREPVIRPATAKELNRPYLAICFSPDLSLFYPRSESPNVLTGELLELLYTRVVDMAGTVPKNVTVKWSLNLDQFKAPRACKFDRVPVRGFKEYVKLFLPRELREELEAKEETLKVAYHSQPRWEVCMINNPWPFPVNVSFVNNISTYEGGEHLKHVQQQVVAYCRDKVEGTDHRRVSQSVMLFVNATIEDPAFKSQCKEELLSAPDTFGSSCELPSRFFASLNRNGVLEQLRQQVEAKEMAVLKRTIGAGKRKDVHDIGTLRDATWAGTRKSAQTVLIVVEGNSAMKLGEVGISVLGSDRCGVMAVRGKFINAGKSQKKLAGNEEFVHVCRAIGLVLGEKTPPERLRYGKLIICTDADVDGSHIKGLFLYFFRRFWPHLLTDHQFVCSMNTPIVVAKRGEELRPFFTKQAYDRWFESLPERERSRWATKHFKGLGTSTTAEGRGYFKKLRHHLRHFEPATPDDLQHLDEIFGQKQSDTRKRWLSDYAESEYIDYDRVRQVKIADFLDKDMKHYSMASLRRGISMCEDGLTPAARKCVWVCMKRKVVEEVKVAELQSLVSQETNYHHNTDILAGTIVRLAQTFVGSQNLNLMVPGGQFGSRADGGKTYSASRYIFSRLAPVTRCLFRPEDDDVLTLQVDENKPIEPVCLCPVVPLILCNGANALGTGYKSDVPMYRPEDLIQRVRAALRGDGWTDPTPWHHKYKGEIQGDSRGNFVSRGRVEKVTDVNYHVTELPLNLPRDDYKRWLNTMLKDQKISNFYERHGDNTEDDDDVRFDVHLIAPLPPDQDLVKFFNLQGKFSSQLNLMTGPDVRIKTFGSVREIFDHWFQFRLQIYEKRRVYWLSQSRAQIPLHEARIKFVRIVLEGRLPLGRKRKELVEGLKGLGIGEEFHDSLLRMSVSTFTEENIDKIERERQACLEEIDYYEKVRPSEMWERDLVALEEALVKHWTSR